MTLMPHGLHNNLLTKACANLSNNTSIMRQYRSKQQPIDRNYSQDELSSLFLSDRRPTSTTSSMDHHQQTAPTPPPPLIQKPQPARIRTGSLVRFADGCDTSGYPPDRAPPIRQDAKGKPKSIIPSLPAGGHYSSSMHHGNNNNNSHQHSTRPINNSTSKQDHVVSNDGENSPLLQEWLLSSNNNDFNTNTSPTHPPPTNYYPIHSNNHATWTTENIPPPPPVANKTVSSNNNKIQQGQPQRPSLWNQNILQQHAGYGTVTATAATTTTATTTGTTTATLTNSSDDPFVDNVPSREVGNRAYSMVSELSEDDDKLAENDGFFNRMRSSEKINGTQLHHEDDEDKEFEEEYGFDPDYVSSDGDKDEITDPEESSQEIVLGLNIVETDSISELQQKRAINQHEHDLDDAESGSHGRFRTSNKRQG